MPRSFAILFKVAHNTTRALFHRIRHEFRKAEIEDVVTGYNKHVVINTKGVDRELNIANCAESGLVTARAIINDGYFLSFSLRPSLKTVSKLVV